MPLKILSLFLLNFLVKFPCFLLNSLITELIFKSKWTVDKAIANTYTCSTKQRIQFLKRCSIQSNIISASIKNILWYHNY